MPLQHIRQKIDRIDTQIVHLIHERLSWALCTTPHKKEVEDPERERRIIERVSRFCSPAIPGPSLTAIYREILQYSRAAQSHAEAPLLILGGSGGPNEAIGHTHFKSHHLITLPDAGDFFRVLCTTPEQEGLLNLDNLPGRTLDQLWNHLRTRTLFVRTVLTEHQSPAAIMVPGGTDHRNLREIWTTPGTYTTHQILFERLHLRPRLFACEGLAARKMVGTGNRHAALAGATACADLFSLEIIRELPTPEEPPAFLFLHLSSREAESSPEALDFHWLRSNRPSTNPAIWQRQFPAHQLCLGRSTIDAPSASLNFQAAFQRPKP